MKSIFVEITEKDYVLLEALIASCLSDAIGDMSMLQFSQNYLQMHIVELSEFNKKLLKLYDDYFGD